MKLTTLLNGWKIKPTKEFKYYLNHIDVIARFQRDPVYYGDDRFECIFIICLGSMRVLRLWRHKNVNSVELCQEKMFNPYDIIKGVKTKLTIYKKKLWNEQFLPAITAVAL